MEAKCIYVHPHAVQQNAEILKGIYIVKEDVELYHSLYEKISLMPGLLNHSKKTGQTKAFGYKVSDIKLLIKGGNEWGGQ